MEAVTSGLRARGVTGLPVVVLNVNADEDLGLSRAIKERRTALCERVSLIGNLRQSRSGENPIFQTQEWSDQQCQNISTEAKPSCFEKDGVAIINLFSPLSLRSKSGYKTSIMQKAAIRGHRKFGKIARKFPAPQGGYMTLNSLVTGSVSAKLLGISQSGLTLFLASVCLSTAVTWTAPWQLQKFALTSLFLPRTLRSIHKSFQSLHRTATVKMQ